MDVPKRPQRPGSFVRPARRAAVKVAGEELVQSRPLVPDGRPLLLLEPKFESVNLRHWASARKEQLDALLAEHGALLLRGFAPVTPAEFEDLIEAVHGPLMEYSYRSTPRSEVSGRIYTSTEYPPDQIIPLHNEMSYARTWPLRIWFCCIQPADRGGETPLADSHRVWQRISPGVRAEFEEKQVMYVRNYGPHLDVPWQQVFQTSDRADVQAFCEAAGIEHEWIGQDGLRTRQVCQAVAAHPVTGTPLWFNQAHLFHVSSLDEAARQSLLAVCKPEELPRNAFFGDGSEIPAEALDEVREAYRAEQVLLPWQRGDIVLADNMRVAHGRMPFAGARKVIVGMAGASGSER